MDNIRDTLVDRYRIYSAELTDKFAPGAAQPEFCEPLRAEELFFFRSLGAFDIAMVALPRTPTQLCGLIHFASEARKLLLEDVCSPESEGECVPGHAFALVEDIIAYRTTRERDGKRSPQRSPDRLKETSDQWKAWGLALQTDVMVDSGHEQHVEEKIPRLKRRKNQKNNPRRISGLHTMRIDYRDVHKFVAEWTPLHSDKNFHIATLIDSTSSLAIRPAFTSEAFRNTSSSTEPAWKLSGKFRAELKRITTVIDAWAESLQILQPEQKRELKSLLHTFTNSFSRLETATAMRDLLPFMRQLAACLGRQEWPAFWKDSQTNRNQIKQDSTKLIAHLGRAFQNRLEPRSQYADPAIYRTLEHGASKIVPAYSTIYWLTSELFSDRLQAPEEKNAHTCPASHCGVCLAIGSNGTVAFSEVFGDFRTYLLREYQALAIKDAPADTEWRSPLILLDASGHQLLEPESHTIHSFHEMILFSDWIQLYEQKPLREKLNIELLGNISTNAADFCDRVAASFQAPEPPATQIAETVAEPEHHSVDGIVQELRSVIDPKAPPDRESWSTVNRYFQPMTIISALDQMVSDKDSDRSELVKQYCRETDPRRALDDFIDTSITRWHRRETLEAARLLSRDTATADYLQLPRDGEHLQEIPGLLEQLFHTEFINLLSEQLAEWSLTFREIIADRIRLRLVYHLYTAKSATPDYFNDDAYRKIADLMADQLHSMGLQDDWDITQRVRMLRSCPREETPLDIIISDTCRGFFDRIAKRSMLTPAENNLTDAFTRIIAAVLKRESPPEPSDETLLLPSLERIDYIMRLWAKSCRLGGIPLFETC